MIKVFLVEDEVIVREGIKNNIDWAGNGYEFCGEAADGELAYSLIEKTRPDIVITDIKMPFMDGIELSRLIKQQLPETEIIILTGFSEFEYAKEGIRIGVAEYLLKPISGADLLEHVNKLSAKILEKRRDEELFETYKREMAEKTSRDRSEFLKALVSGGRGAGEVLSLAKEQGINLSAMWYNMILVKSASQHHESREDYSETLVRIEEALSTMAGEDRLLIFDRNLEGKALLVKAESFEEVEALTDSYVDQMIRIYEQYPYVSYFGGVGKPVSRLNELPESFESAGRAFAYRYLIDENKFIRYSEIDSLPRAGQEKLDIDRIDTKQFSRSKLLEFLKLGDKEETVYFIEEFFRGLGENAANSLMFRQYLAMDAYFCVSDFVEELAEGSRESVEKIDPAGENVKTRTATMQYMIRIVENAVSLRQQSASNRYQDVVRQVETYILEHFADEELSLNLIASHVNFSPNHLSTIFSQQTGQTLIKYLTDFRMNRAKELLRGSSKKSSEISMEVGYKDPHYFSYLFKKTQGMTPTQYRDGKADE